MAKKKKQPSPLNPKVVYHHPKCGQCGYQNERSCVEGASCPQCKTRLTPETIERVSAVEHR